MESSWEWPIRGVAVRRRANRSENPNVQIPMTNFITMLRTKIFLVIGIWSLVISSSAIADGLAPVGKQPNGGLSGKIVYTHGGHGITAENKKDGSWSFQRGPSQGMIEDLGNVEQMAFLVDYLFRAGATVVPLRPVGDQTNEVVLDNDDAGITFVGDWSEPKNAPVYFGKPGHVP